MTPEKRGEMGEKGNGTMGGRWATLPECHRVLWVGVCSFGHGHYGHDHCGDTIETPIGEAAPSAFAKLVRLCRLWGRVGCV